MLPKHDPNEEVRQTVVDVDPATLLAIVVALLFIPLLAAGLFAH
jgi:hypothetical protein